MKPRSLPVIMPVISGQRWSCHSCGNCCRTLVGHLTLTERDQIVEQNWAAELGVEPVVRAGRAWVLNKRNDGACVFLDEHNRCRIHARFGEAAKPLACRIFPFSVRPTSRGWQATLRFDCPSVVESKGALMDTHRAWLEELAQALPAGPIPDDRVQLKRGLRAHPGEVEAFLRRIRKWLIGRDTGIMQKCIGAARLSSTLSAARLHKVRDDRFSDLLDVLFETLPGELALPLDPPTPRQDAMLRQAAFAHAEHVSLAELRSGIFGRLSQRWDQLKSSRRMLDGVGEIPSLPGLKSGLLFEQVARVEGALADADKVEDLLRRYLTARIEGDAVFGAGYYGWPLNDGFSALWLSVAVAGWLARVIAAGRGATNIDFSDAGAALGMVDRAATRLPALGTWAERNRVGYLMMDDGLARLVRRYSLVAPSTD